MESKTAESQNVTLDLLIQLLNWRGFILKVTLVGTVLAIVIALVITKQYISFASVRATSTDVSLGKLLQSSGAASGFGALADFALPKGGGEIDYLIAILNSRTVQDKMIEKFDLRKRYGTAKIEDTREILKGNTVIRRDILAELASVGVYDEDPSIAAEMTDFYVHLLNELFTSLNSQAARNNRENIETRYQQTLAHLSILEDSLRSFQEHYGVYDIKTQTETAIRSAASLKSEIMLKEIELGVKRNTLGQDSPEISRLTLEISQMNKSFDEMLHGHEQKQKETIFIPFATAPSLGLTYVRMFRDVQIYNELLKVLIPMLEQAQLQEKRETPSLVVLDHPIVPEKKSKPQRLLIVLIGMLSSFVVACIVAFMMEHLNNTKIKNPERYKKLSMIYEMLLSDVRFWHKRRQ